MSAVRVCQVTDSECFHSCNSGPCKLERRSTTTIPAPDAITVLRELVRLKDLKERLGAREFAGPLLSRMTDEEFATGRADYLENKPKAWDESRATLQANAAGPVTQTEYCWLVELFEAINGNSAGFYHTGFVDIGGCSRTTTKAHEARRYTKEQALAVAEKLGAYTLTGVWRAVEHGFEAAVGTPVPARAQEVTDEQRGAIAYQLTKRLVIDISTARAAVDAAVSMAEGL